jgi:tRNA threonylcarbamoyladenosine biosynthesis protein TsaE
MATPTTLVRTISSASPDATRAIAGRLAAVALPGDLLCLWGDLGAGKTVFAKGFGAGLGVPVTITSPTFILMAEYAGRLPLFHLDLFRLDDASDVLSGGLLDERRATGVTLVEWPDRLGAALPIERLDVLIEGSADEPRTITLRAGTAALARYLPAAGEA